MKYLSFLISLFLTFQFTIYGQELSREFGKIGKEESGMTSYTPDRSAAAVVLFDLGRSYFEREEHGFNIIYERTTRIKIFSEAGIKYAEIEIPYYQEGGIFEKVFDLEAYTYNPSGDSFMRTALNPSTVHEEKLTESWNVKKFAMPDVKPGSIIEYHYRINSEYVFNLRDWEFQCRIPTIFSEYEVKMIPFYEYTLLLQGKNKFDNNVSYKDQNLPHTFAGIEYNDLVHKFTMRNLPAFNDEEYITSINDFIIKVEFQLVKINHPDGTTTNVISTWPELVKDLLKDDNLAKFAKRCEKLADKVLDPDSVANRSQIKKFDIVLNYVKANFNWNQVNSKYSSKSANELLKDKFGNSADLNLLALGLLNASGIEAWPVIISTRDHGKLKPEYPLMKSFNYVIIDALIDGKHILTDATETLCPNDMVPARCLNEKGLLIKEGPVEWVSIQNNVPSEIEMITRIDLADTGSVARTIITSSRYDALRHRQTYGDDKKKIADRGTDEIYKVDESSVSILNQYTKEKPYIFNFIRSFGKEELNGKIYLSPFLNEVMADNPLKQNSRSYPIDMTYPVKRNFTSTIMIPDGYKIEFLPEDEKILNEMFEMSYNIKREEKSISVCFSYAFKKTLYNAADYLNLKYYFKEIIKKGNEKMVFVKE